MAYNFNSHDRTVIRNLAKKQLEYAVSPEMSQLKDEWRQHNDLKGKRPMVTVELGTFAGDVIPDLLQCEDPQARNIEWMLRANVANRELFGDDTVVRDYIPVGWFTYFKPYNIDIKVDHTKLDGKESLGHHFVSIIKDLHDDFNKLGKSTYGANKEATLDYINSLNELMGDILPARLASNGLYSVPTQNIVHFMSMEDMFISMYDYPDEFRAIMDRQAEDHLAFYRFMADEKLIMPTTGDQWLGQGTYCFTDELPGNDELEKRNFTSKDVWGFMDSQETVGISADMFEEFIFPCYKKIADSYGLLSYGCCEPVDPIWDRCLSKLPNLRKLSISPWCNEEKMGEKLQGSRIIYHRKPSPNYLGVGTVLDEDGLRKHIEKTLKAAAGCKIEFTQRDVYAINKDIAKVNRYVQILREEIETHWKP